MTQGFLLAIGILVALELTRADVQAIEPENGQELADFLYQTHKIGCGVDNDGNIIVVSFNGDEVADVGAAIERVVRIQTIERLQIDHARINGEMLGKLRQLLKLSALRFLYCQLATEKLSSLKDLPLTELDFTGIHISDEELEHFASLKKLGRLKLSTAQLTGSGFKHLADMPLRELTLSTNPITDESLKLIGQFTSLRHLDLSNTPITDDGLSHLPGLYQLHSLVLNETLTSHAGRELFRQDHAKSRRKAEKLRKVPPGYPQLSIAEY